MQQQAVPQNGIRINLSPTNYNMCSLCIYLLQAHTIGEKYSMNYLLNLI